MSESPARGRILTLIGADGAGKSTHAQRLVADFRPAATYVYLGSNPAAATHALPTTQAWSRLKAGLGREAPAGGPPAVGPARRPRTLVRRIGLHLKSLIMVALRGSEDLYRLWVARDLARRGHLVVLDRHPWVDYHRRRIRGDGGWMRLGDRVHALLLRHVYPKPREVVLLDAPAEVLYERKPEGTLDAVRARRQEYLDLAAELPPDVALTVLDASAEEDVVAGQLRRIAGAPWVTEGSLGRL